MAQLIKLNDYISRYEIDLARYSSLFVRLKKRRWMEIKNSSLIESEKGEGREEQLKQFFLDQFFMSQIKWASSTTSKRSYAHSSLFADRRLRSLLQRFPDTVLVMYHPVFQIKKAKVEVEVLMITPSQVICLTHLDAEDNAIYIGSNAHFWTKETQAGSEKILSPLLSIKRMDKVIKQIFQVHGIDIPIQKAVVAENGYISVQHPPDDIDFIDKQNYERWIQQLRAFHTPMKMMQFRAANVLLDYCQTTSVRRTDAVSQY